MRMQDDLGEIANSAAFLILDNLLSVGKLSSAEIASYKSQFSTIHSAVLQIFTNEKLLLEKAKQMKTLLESERLNLEKRSKQAQIAHLDTEALEKQEKELHEKLDDEQEKHEQSEQRLNSINEQVAATERMLDEKQATAIESLKGPRDALAKEIAEFEPAIRKTLAEIEKLKEDNKKFQEEIDSVHVSIGILEKEKERRVTEHATSLPKPNRLQSDIVMIQNVIKERSEDSEQKRQTLAGHERTLTELAKQKDSVLAEIARQKHRVETLQSEIQKKQESVEDMKRQKEDERDETDKMQEAKRENELLSQELLETLKRHWTTINEHHKEYQIKKKTYERLRRKRDTLVSVIPPLKDQVEAAAEQVWHFL